MDGIAIWQFTSTYIAGGLDANVDLTELRITDIRLLTNQKRTHQLLRKVKK